MLSSPAMQAEMARRAQAIAAEARASAPVETGSYAGSITTRDASAGRDRAAAQAGSPLPYAMAVEATHGVLHRAMDAGA